MNDICSSGVELVSVRGLSKRYIQRRTLSRASITIRALAGINLSIQRGRTLALIGRSGAGKSTLARCLALIETPSEGEILFEGKSILSIRRSELFPLRRNVQIVFQDPTSSLNPRMTAAEIICEPLNIHRIGSTAERHEKSKQLLTQVGLPADCGCKKPFELSGGQRQRLAIARALALEPRLLILDEALSNLDLMNRESILHLLAQLQSAFSLTYVHVLHDLGLASRLADEVVVMQDGRIIEHQPADRLFSRPKSSHTRELLAAMPSLESICSTRFARECR
jgi:peptide/nickel transport system ATP-binding protein